MKMKHLEQWEAAVGGDGLKFFNSWLTSEESSKILNAVDSDDFPWNLKPKLYGTKLPQHSYLYQRKKTKAASKGLKELEELCQRISNEFECTVSDVYCNRFADPTHKIDWHQDQYASHIMVLSLGSGRGLEFRDNKTKEITRYDPKAGDLYFMSLQHNKLYHHRVLSLEEDGIQSNDATRVSFVFFISAPFNKKEYKVGLGETLFGGLNALMS